MNSENHNIAQEVSQRRTFAIISHPDAGKTTLTEKLLLYSGMIRTAGMVRGRKNAKAASSDWMDMEKERGISITASAMQFAYKGVVINVLDTPGHQDFSEDTYRTLTAADCAVMVIDAAKGVEIQTRKLFQVCRMRGIPILTFINKMDLPGQEPLDLLAEVEEVLGIQSSALNWPIGSGKNFRGVYNRQTAEVIFFEKESTGGKQKAKAEHMSLDDAINNEAIDSSLVEQLREDLELLDEAGNVFSREAFLKGEITPVFFGSALTNFGVEPFFDTFAELAPCPQERSITNDDGSAGYIDPFVDAFSAYVFKIQANMDLRHRDSMAYLRVCSGVFERDMQIQHSRLAKSMKLSRSHSMFGGGRTTLDLAFPGDIVGVVNPGSFAIGDTISAKGGFTFQPLPKFPPEVVARIRPKDAMRRKSFEKGMKQFRDEGAVLILEPFASPSSEPLIAAVGVLQFEVLKYRLEQEYKVDTVIETLAYQHGAWLIGDPANFKTSSSSMLALDGTGQCILLYTRDWERQFLLEKNPDYQLLDFVN